MTELETVIRDIVRDEVRRQMQMIKPLAPPPQSNELIIGDKALADALGVSLSTISRYLKQGRLNGAIIERSPRRHAYDLEQVKTILTT